VRRLVTYEDYTPVTSTLSNLFAGAILGAVPTTETAPGELELVRTFVNTYDLMPAPGKDEVATPAMLRAWLVERGLVDADAPVDAPALARAVAVREALRALIAADGAPAPEVVAQLEEAAARAPLQVHFDGGVARLEPTDRGVDGALARLLGIVHDAMHTGAWQRMKACGDPGCLWAFYDHSKNRSGVWCNMASCGNRNKARRRRAQA
jgi:predicted RNA-binding Zn ribbon-like protein